MAAPLNRSWYDTLIDDSGDGVSGTVWNKAQVDGLLDTVDASLAGLVDKSGTPVANELARFSDADTVQPSGILAPSGSLLFNADTTIGRNTADGSDNGAIRICGGGANASNRGGRVIVGGNESGLTGNVYLIAGDAPGATVQLVRGDGATSVSLDSNGVLTLAHGRLRFPATQNPDSDPYTLDDYREGTFTPVLIGGTGQSGQTYSAQVGEYVKIGRRCFFSLWVQLSNKGTFTGNVYVSNLPFSGDILGGPGFLSSISVGQFANVASAVVNITGTVQSNQNIALFAHGPGGTTSSPNFDPALLTNTTSLFVTGHYRTIT